VVLALYEFDVIIITKIIIVKIIIAKIIITKIIIAKIIITKIIIAKIIITKIIITKIIITKIIITNYLAYEIRYGYINRLISCVSNFEFLSQVLFAVITNLYKLVTGLVNWKIGACDDLTW
jgi:hypothetical protein